MMIYVWIAIVIVAVALVIFAFYAVLSTGRINNIQIVTQRVNILKIYRLGYQAYHILSQGDNNEIIEYYCSPHCEGTRLFVDATDENPPYAILRKVENSTIGAEIHIRSLDDLFPK